MRVLAALAFVIGCSRPAPSAITPGDASSAGCQKDVDCKGTRICDLGQCVDPPHPPSSIVPLRASNLSTAPRAEYVPSGKRPRRSKTSHWTAPGDRTHPSPIWSEKVDCTGQRDNTWSPMGGGHDGCRWILNNARDCHNGLQSTSLAEGRRCYVEIFVECNADDSSAERLGSTIACP